MFGFAFKKDTGDTRESAAIDVAKHLLAEGASLSIYDPKVSSKQIHRDLGHDTDIGIVGDKSKSCGLPADHINGHDERKSFDVKSCPYEAAQKAHAIVVCTEWDEFKDYDYSRIYDNMEKPAFIFDGRKILDHEKLLQIGFRVETIGKKLNPMNSHGLM